MFSCGKYCKSQGSGAPERSQNDTKFHLKINQNNYQSFNIFFHGFGRHVGSIFQLKSLPESNRKSMPFLFEKSTEINAKMTPFGSQGGLQRTSFSLIGPFLGTPCRPKGPHSAQGEALGGQMEAKELQNGAKMVARSVSRAIMKQMQISSKSSAGVVFLRIRGAWNRSKIVLKTMLS